MTKTVEAVVDDQGRARLLQTIHLESGRRALVVILDEPGDLADETALVSEAALSDSRPASRFGTTLRSRSSASVVDEVLADQFGIIIHVSLVYPELAAGKGPAQSLFPALQLDINCNFAGGLNAVGRVDCLPPGIAISLDDLGAVVYIELRDRDLGRVDELDLFGFVVGQAGT